MRRSTKLFSSMFFALSLILSGCDEDPCGNGQIDDNAGESCDGNDLGTVQCSDYPSFGQFVGGKPACTNQCLLDLSACDKCWGYPCEPYGHTSGEVMGHQTWLPGNNNAVTLAADQYFELSDLYTQSKARDGSLTGMLLFVTTSWCPACVYQAEILNEVYAAYKDRGLTIVTLVIQDEVGRPATELTAQAYSDKYGWTDISTVAGSLEYAYWDDPQSSGAFPLTLFIDLQTMKIYKRQIGALSSLDAELDDSTKFRDVLDQLVAGPFTE